MKKFIFILLFLSLSNPLFAQLKITELTEDTAPTTDDMTVTVNDPAGTPATKKSTVGNLLREPNHPSTLTRDTEWDTIGEIETATSANILVSTELDTIAELETLLGLVNVLLETEIDASSELIALMDDETGTGALVFGTSPTLTTPNIGSATGSISGNAGTATALAANPADCSVSTEFAVGILASGVATCEAIADADVPNTITIDNATTAANLGADGVDALTEISTAIKTAAEDTSKLVVGTAGSNGELAKWNTDGTLTDGNLILSTLTDGRICSYTSSGTLLSCNLTCADITGSSDLCDGSDAVGSGGGSGVSDYLPVSRLTPATSTVGIYTGAFTSTWTSTTGNNLWTSAVTAGDTFKIVNTGALASNGSILKVSNTGNPTGGAVVQIENTDTDMLSMRGPNFTVSQAGTFTAPLFVGALTGNSTTATALASNGANCSAGSYPLGVDASGAVESCTVAGTGGSADSIAYHKITSPLTNSGINFGSFTNTWTSSVGNATAFTIDGSGTDFVVQGDGDTTVADLTVGGDDIFMATNTTGHLLIADGTNFNPTGMSGDVTINSSGSTTIQANAVALGTDTTGGYASSGSEGGPADSALSIAYHLIKAPTTNSGIDFGTFNNTWTSTTGNNVWTAVNTTGDYFKIVNSGNLDPNGSVLKLTNTGNPTGGAVLQIENSDSDMVSIKAPGFIVPKAGLINCNTIDTDANGVLVCGTDGGGGGTSMLVVNLPIYSAKLTGAFAVRTPSGGDASVAGTIDAGDGNWRGLFDATTDEAMVWQFRMPNNYSSTPVLKLQYSMSSATSGTVEWEGDLMCVSSGDSADIGTASFSGVAVVSETVPGTAGYMSEVSISLTDDSCTAGDSVFVYVSTDANDGTNDTATGDRELINATFSYTGL